MTAFPLRGDVTDIAAVLKAVRIRVPPPFALVVVNAAGIEAQIAAERSQVAVAWRGDGSGSLRQGAIVRPDGSVSRNRCDRDAGADRHSAVAGIDLGKFADTGNINQHIWPADATTNVHEQVCSARDKAALWMRQKRRDRLFEGGGLRETQLG